MAVEIRQLVVKSNLVQAVREPDVEPRTADVDLEQLRQSVLHECREMIAEMLEQKRER